MGGQQNGVSVRTGQAQQSVATSRYGALNGRLCIIWEGWQPYITTLIFLELALESIILLQTQVNAIGEERRVPVSIDPDLTYVWPAADGQSWLSLNAQICPNNPLLPSCHLPAFML